MTGEGKGFLAKHNRFVNNKNKLLIIFALIAVLVVIGVFWWLKLVGITATGDAMCGIEEHTHSEKCYDCNKPAHAHTSECKNSTVPYMEYVEADTDVIVKGDGSTIVNVYYEYKSYTIHFRKA